MNFIVLLLLVHVCVAANLDPQQEFSSRLSNIAKIVNNNPESTWVAFPNKRFQSFDDVRRQLGARRENQVDKHQRRPTVTHNIDSNNLPTEFDSRKAWPMCIDTIDKIRDQSSCGSCWAFGAVEAMSDRVCIHSKGETKVILSALDMLSCCEDCGDGCNGGYPGLAWDFWKNSGIVTGDSKEKDEGCAPYPFPSCAHHGVGKKPACPKELYDTPKCLESCKDDYEVPYSSDKYYAKSSYNVHHKPEEIMNEIMTNGPVEASFEVYEDFVTYHSGIYKHARGEYLGGHAIRVLGWGVENKVPYWIAANSWNADWGENGYFRIFRGNDECGIESDVVAGMPFLKRT